MLRRIFLALPAAVLCAQTAQPPVVVVLIGPPASGKTTQADYLTRKYKIPVISVEKLVGDEMERGDPQVSELVRKELVAADTSGGFILDGYPATRAQATYLAGMLKELGLPSPLIVHLQVPDEVARERARERNGPWDAPARVEKRLTEYHREMQMVRAYYPEADIWTVQGTRPIDEVSQTIRLLVEDR